MTNEVLIERLTEEKSKLEKKLYNLRVFMESDTYKSLSEKEREMLYSQRFYMLGYYNTLIDRIEFYVKKKQAEQKAKEDKKKQKYEGIILGNMTEEQEKYMSDVLEQMVKFLNNL